jgi:hypothetical protein
VGKNGSLVLELTPEADILYHGKRVGRMEPHRILRDDGTLVVSVGPGDQIVTGSGQKARFEGAGIVVDDGRRVELDAAGEFRDERGSLDVRVENVTDDNRRTALLLWASLLPLVIGRD